MAKELKKGDKDFRQMGPAEVQATAERLKSLATTIEDYAKDLADMKARPASIAMGNFENGITLIEGWINSQIAAAVIKGAQANGLAVKVSVRPKDAK